MGRSAAIPARAQTGEFHPGQYIIERVRAVFSEVTTIIRTGPTPSSKRRIPIRSSSLR